ncbi:MAG: DUF5333 domain-containing protein [Pseudomonadota bacterium]|uniref:DUF5333 domain-containing protein n=1 Tax=Roseovarius TaxID=74030 RepID=UPI0022A8CFE1|nr:DUF5333 domain-containing protein [Roseovarius sp. EGI FJ00037]MCZ0811915.1 DUF5333 domain-containing protein [Roseovarius sp. EGI FJ00037]
MINLKPYVLIAAMSATAAMGQASTQQTGLPGEADINAGLLTVAVADKIRRACGDISARFFTARSYVSSLKEMAVERGYSEAEIDAYINDDIEKARMREKRNEYFKARGASNYDPASLCDLGRAEIQKQSQIGLLLRAK